MPAISTMRISAAGHLQVFDGGHGADNRPQKSGHIQIRLRVCADRGADGGGLGSQGAWTLSRRGQNILVRIRRLSPAAGSWLAGDILIDQGGADTFLEEQLRPELFQVACDEVGVDLQLRMQPGYDHSYYFIASFMRTPCGTRSGFRRAASDLDGEPLPKQQEHAKQSDKHWVGSWTASPAPSTAGIDFANHTIRMHPRISIGGATVRVRISNAHGDANLAIGGVTIALRDEGPSIVPESLRRLTFGSEPGTRIAAGAVAYSDPVVLDVPPSQPRSIWHLPGAVPAALVTGRYARQTNYISPPGDFSERRSCRSARSRRVVLPRRHRRARRPETGGIVALGDS